MARGIPGTDTRMWQSGQSYRAIFPLNPHNTMNPSPNPGGLQTPGFSHYSVAWSPFHTTRLALASAANFGLVGNGRLHIVSVNPDPSGPSRLNIDKQCDTFFHLPHKCSRRQIWNTGWSFWSSMVRNPRKSARYRIGWRLNTTMGCHVKRIFEVFHCLLMDLFIYPYRIYPSGPGRNTLAKCFQWIGQTWRKTHLLLHPGMGQ